jgi:hypothetical protein
MTSCSWFRKNTGVCPSFGGRLAARGNFKSEKSTLQQYLLCDLAVIEPSNTSTLAGYEPLHVGGAFLL